MKVAKDARPDWGAVIHRLGERFAPRVEENDGADQFVAKNYEEMREARLFSACIPEELGGGGVSHGQMCRMIRSLASYDPSTALALSMHQHLIAASVWNYRHDRPGKELLEKVASGELVLVSTGGNDWLGSTGEAKRVEGGFRVSAFKPFASGGPAGDIIVTSSPYDDPEEGPQVLHFAVPMAAEGVSHRADWRAHGMRGTGSNTLVFEEVFIPEESVVLSRPRNAWHPVWNLVVSVAVPLYTSAYVGAADAAAALAIRKSDRRKEDITTHFALGEMKNALATADLAMESMIEIINGPEFAPSLETADAILTRRTLATRATCQVAESAVEAVGGSAYFRKNGLERLLRDVRAGQFHPLPPKKQILFSGRVALGLEPIAN